MLDSDALAHRVDDLARQLGDHVFQVKQRMTEGGLTHPIIARLAHALTARSLACRQILQPT